ncbi:MAG: two-component regulator propeller domain-containing protein [candidate division KSB1 bacterium]
MYCILQDRQSFMWFGTQGGLNKYDGYKFTVYQEDVFDSTSLAQNVNNVMCEDHTGTLWFGSMNAAVLNRFERETESFTRFKHDPNNPHSLSNGGVSAIYEDHTGTLWVGTSNGLNKFDREQEQFTRFQFDPKDSTSLHGYSVFSIYEDRSGTLWIGTGRWLNKFDREQEQFVHYEHDPQHPRNRKARQITSIFEDRGGALWLGSEGAGLKKFDRENGLFTSFFHDPMKPHSLSSDSVEAIYEDRSGTLWIGTWNGLNLFDRVEERFIHFLPDPKNPHSLKDKVIWDIYQDRSGILWIGTFMGGANKVDRNKEQFTQIAHDPDNPHSLSDNGAQGFYTDHTGTLWVGAGNGLNRFDSNTKQFTSLVHDPKNSNSLCDNNVDVINEDYLGMLWLGTNKGLDKFDPTQKRFTHYVHDPNNPHSLSSDLIVVIYEDRDHVLWIGTFGGGLNKFDREQNRFTRFVYDAENQNSINGNYVWAVCEDSLARNILWIAADGLNRFDRDTERFTRFVNDPKNPRSLSHDYVGPLWVDRRGTLWVGTLGGGLNRFDNETEQFSHFTTKDGLPDNQVCGIIEDDHGRLWLSTGNGLSRFDPKTKTFRNYDVADGLASNSFVMPSQHESADDEMFWGSDNSGFTRFHPDSIKDNPYIPPVVITAFKRYNTDDAKGIAIEEKGISAKKEISVSYKDNVLSFEFAALSYRNTFKNQYAYKLEGFSDNWIQLGAKREITFTNLDPGEYTLRVKGSNNDGVWNEAGTSLKITVTPPWWQTRWAYACFLVLFGAALYGWRRYDLNRIHLKNQLKLEHVEAEKMKELDHLKSRFFANLSHEFRTPLTLILGPLEQLQTEEFKGNVKEAYAMMLRNGQRLLRLINQLLDLARLEAGRMTLQARPENIVGFLKGLVLSFASAAERKRIALSISAEEEALIIYFDRDKLEKIVSNLLSNALKFTPEGGRVDVVVRSSQNNTPLNPPSRGDFSNVPSSEREKNAIPPLRGARGVLPQFMEFSVSDTGPGIPVEQREKIFDRFYQVDPSHTREHEGTGIGLALTKELVELHHGEILVQSEIGQGTTFIVRLPLGKEHLRPEEVISDQLSVTSLLSTKIED